MAPPSRLLVLEREMQDGELLSAAGGEVGVFSTRGPGKSTPNEDAAAVVEVDEGRSVLAVADGMGGGPAGELAAARVLESVCEAVASPRSEHGLRDAILDGLETANRSVSEVASGAATTFAAAELDGSTCRTYHVGDSCVLLVGQRGRIKHLTTAHSPTGYAVEAGVLNEDEALEHEERHLVSNVVGSAEMKIELGPALDVAPRDTLLLGTDGLFDNMRIEEIVDIVRAGPLGVVVKRLAGECRGRMAAGDDAGSKPDDLTFVVYRRR